MIVLNLYLYLRENVEEFRGYNIKRVRRDGNRLWIGCDCVGRDSVCGILQVDGNEPTIFVKCMKFLGRRNIYHHLKAFTVHCGWSNLLCQQTAGIVIF
jgi:hypothetical protein